MKKFVWIVAAILLTGCTHKNQLPTGIEPVRVKTMQSESGTITDCNKYIGTIEESASIPLSFAVPGTIQKVLIDDGSPVREGQVLAIIDKTSLQNTYSAARATLLQAEDGYRRLKSLYDKGSLSDVKYVEIQTKLEQAKSAAELAKKNLEDGTLKAPASGVIADCEAKNGANVMPGIKVMNLVQTNTVFVKIAIPEEEIDNVKEGASYSFSVNAIPGKTFKGIVTNKSITANPLSHSYEIKLTVNNARGELRPGMTCQMNMKKGKGNNHSTLIVLPQQAIFMDENNKAYVWTIEDGKAKRRYVELGDLTAQGVTITDGLTNNDIVITEGQNKVSDGTKVKAL